MSDGPDPAREAAPADDGPPHAGCLTWLIPQVPVVLLTVFVGLTLLVGVVARVTADAARSATAGGEPLFTELFFGVIAAPLLVPAALLGLGTRAVAIIVSSIAVGFVLASLLEIGWLGFRRLRLDDPRWIKKGAAWGSVVGALISSGELARALAAPAREAVGYLDEAWYELAIFGCIAVWIGGAFGAIVLAIGKRDRRQGRSMDRALLQRIPTLVKRWIRAGVVIALSATCWVTVFVPLLSQLGSHPAGPPSLGAALGFLFCITAPMVTLFGAAGAVHHRVNARKARA